MSITVKFQDVLLGVGDRVKVYYKIKEKEKERLQLFEGLILAINGKAKQKNIVVRKIGVQQIGIERIFPLYSPQLDKIEVLKSGYKGVKQAKIYYVRKKSKKEIDRIYYRSVNKN